MHEHPYRIVNVFTSGDDPFSGNPLCVFEDGTDVPPDVMQALARQFNLSETTFVLPRSNASATARVRIFTPSFEMPFAGHPTLGTAHVVRATSGAGDKVVLEMQVGLVEVRAEGDDWTLRAARTPETRPPAASRDELAAMLGIEPASIGQPALWVNTGAEQLVVPLVDAEAVERARPNADLLARIGHSDKAREAMAYVWAPSGEGEVVARFFFLANGSPVEDPATGSACANLGGWLVATKARLPARLRVRQGDAVKRPSVLTLYVDEGRNIFVSGRVRELGRGIIRL
jgi:trans-2,3-dihydro-3-hydroxyanthranilate isomerase